MPKESQAVIIDPYIYWSYDDEKRERFRILLNQLGLKEPPKPKPRPKNYMKPEWEVLDPYMVHIHVQCELCGRVETTYKKMVWHGRKHVLIATDADGPDQTMRTEHRTASRATCDHCHDDLNQHYTKEELITKVISLTRAPNT
jgi:hypothetical protein